jgi:hypothetical protein
MREFVGFNKIPRLSREVIITEKIDGTNASIFIGEDGEFLVGSRTRWITPDSDNFGFAAWAYQHKDELMQLGPGQHFGEWWGSGIQRNYGLKERRFSLFNTMRWNANLFEGNELRKQDQCNPKAPYERKQFIPPPACCDVVPVLHAGEFDTAKIQGILTWLGAVGSLAELGFMRPEGVVVYHVAGNYLFKKTIEKDDEPKGNQ